MPTTNYVWDDDNLLYETDGTGAVTAEYTNSPEKFGNLISEHRGGTTYTHHYDGQGSTIALTDESGMVVDAFAYDASGKQLTPEPTIPTPFRWIGKFGYNYDAETASFDVRRRPYSPATVRWVSQDPAGFIDGPNRYLYVHNNPLNGIDPSGRAKGIWNQICEVGSGLSNLGIGGAYSAAFGQIATDAKQFSTGFIVVGDSSTENNARQNASRHCYWQAMLTLTYGQDAARNAGNAHEYGEQGSVDSQVDKWNNIIGRDIGGYVRKKYPPGCGCPAADVDSLIRDLCTKSMQSGDLISSANDPRISGELNFGSSSDHSQSGDSSPQ